MCINAALGTRGELDNSSSNSPGPRPRHTLRRASDATLTIHFQGPHFGSRAEQRLEPELPMLRGKLLGMVNVKGLPCWDVKVKPISAGSELISEQAMPYVPGSAAKGWILGEICA